MTGYVIVAKITAPTGQEKRVASQIDDLALATRAEAGCIRYEIYRDVNDHATTLIYEVWADIEAWRTHVTTAHLQTFKLVVLKEKASMTVEKLLRDSEKAPTTRPA